MVNEIFYRNWEMREMILYGTELYINNIQLLTVKLMLMIMIIVITATPGTYQNMQGKHFIY